MLDALGLSPAQSTVYEAMLTRPECEISALASALALPEKDVGGAISALIDLSLLQRCPDNPAKIRPVSPRRVFQDILRRCEANLARSQQELAAARVAVTIAVATGQRSVASISTECLVGQDIIQARLESLAAQTASEWLIVLTSCSSRTELNHSRGLDPSMADRGVRVRVIIQDSARNDIAVAGSVLCFFRTGGQVRTAPLLPTPMFISDRRVAVLPVDSANPAAGVVWTQEPGIVSALTAVFDHAWITAQPMSRHPARDSRAGPAPGQRELLTLLAAGLTDEAAAGRLGISLRTARRQMANLMDRLGAISRFQAGVQAGRNGWLDQAASSVRPTELLPDLSSGAEPDGAATAA